jgi:sugar/nucleoside kinase (ribokinase family)
MKPVLTIGPVYCDLLLEGFSDIPKMGEELFLDSYVLSAGGNAIVASAISQLGVPSAILGTIGSDLMGEQLRSLLQEKQVGIDYLLSVPS